tara:strand:- start:865 stop:1080 length:216 start_codon:yes stop_codon:yes gene_type:complete
MRVLDYLDDWVFITTPKGEKININIHSEGENDAIRVNLYEMETTNEGYDQTCSMPYASINIHKLTGDINNE